MFTLVSKEEIIGACWYSVNQTYTWFHFDSSQGANKKQANLIAYRMRPYVGTSRIIESKCTQQDDSYNCGAFLMLYAEIAANRAVTNISMEKACYVDRLDVTNMRRRVLEVSQHNRWKGTIHMGENIPERRRRSTERESEKTVEKKKTCSSWVRGDCRLKDACSYLHPMLCPEIMETGVCTQNYCSLYHPKMCRKEIKYGNCINGKRCYFTSKA